MSYRAPEPLAWNYCPTCGTPLLSGDDGESMRPHCAGCRRFFYHNPAPAACCFVAREDGALLFARRAVEPCAGEWSLPGGFVELNERADEAALRELREETQLSASGARLIGVSTSRSIDGGAVLVLGYVVEGWRGRESMRPSSDVSELAFFLPQDRPHLPFEVHRELLALYDAAHT